MSYSSKEQKKKFKKISKVITIDKIFHSDKYYFDNGQVEEIIDIIKDNIKYSIMKVKPNRMSDEYLVYVLIRTPDNYATHQLLEECVGTTNTDKSFNKLKKFIEKTSNDDIINKCYDELANFPRKNFLIKLLGV